MGRGLSWCCRADPSELIGAARAARVLVGPRSEWGAVTGVSSWQVFWQAWVFLFALSLVLYRAQVSALLEQQRLDDDRHHVGGFDDAPDVDIVELLELHGVDRDHVGGRRDLPQNDAAEALADIAVDQQH